MDLDVCGSVSFLLSLLTAVSASEEVGWADAGSADHHLVVHCPLHLQRKSDSKELGDAGKVFQNCCLHRGCLKKLMSDCRVNDVTV